MAGAPDSTGTGVPTKRGGRSTPLGPVTGASSLTTTGGESRPVSPSGPSDDRPVGGQPSPYSRPSSPRSQVGEGGRPEQFDDVGQGLVLGVILESEKHRNKENSPSTTTSWHTLWSRMHRPHTRSASPEQACLSLAHHWQIGMRHARWPCAVESAKNWRESRERDSLQ